MTGSVDGGLAGGSPSGGAERPGAGAGGPSAGGPGAGDSVHQPSSADGDDRPAPGVRSTGGPLGLLSTAAGRVRAAAINLRERAEAAAAAPHPRGSPPAPDLRPTEGLLQASEPPPPPPGPVRPSSVPRALQQAAAWAWRILLVGLLIYVAFRVASTLRLVVLPCLASLLLTALLQPLTSRLRRIGLASLAATWCTILVAIIVLAGVGTLAANRVSADYPQLSRDINHTAHDIQTSLAGPPFHVNSARLQHYSDQLGHFLTQHQSLVAGTVVTGGRIVLELLTGLILTIFITFFLLKDGNRIWAWLISGLRADPRQRAGHAGLAAWAALVNYMRGTTVVAAIHALSIGLALWLLGVPLLVPLIILVFLAAFVPLVGILVVGALAILITLGTKGALAAVILLAVFLLENQVESHLLQPLVVGRIVRLHPLAIILVLAVGSIIGGIGGAIIAVPTAAAISHAWPHLWAHEPEPGPVSAAVPVPGPAPEQRAAAAPDPGPASGR